MNPRTRTLSLAFAVVAGFFTLAVVFGASAAHGTQIAPGVDSPLGTTPPGSVPGTVPEAPAEARETEAHLTTPVPVKVTPTYTG